MDFFDENNNGGNNRGNSESGGQSGGPQSNGSERGSQNGGKQVQYYSNGRFSNGSNSSSAGNANTAPPTAQVPATLTAEETSAASQVQNTTREITMTKAESVCPAGQKLS
ncbi:MAG: hypothetical protein ACLSFO_01490 [Anaerovoracaceae bacterium]